MTDAVRRGLSMAFTLSDSWREADGDETVTAMEVEDMAAAEDWINRGGLARDRPDPEDPGPPLGQVPLDEEGP